ncbi:MAG TPA: ribbon-helix-helix domain-containing protein [Aliidongia sp.]|nr:ribbon-helix-helix domain-containing protein [Aliidongia sp.]
MDQSQARDHVPSTLINRNVTVMGRRTSVRLEQAMWDALEEICRRERKVMNRLITEIEQNRHESSLTAAIRVTIMLYFKNAATERGHVRAGHGSLRKVGTAYPRHTASLPAA